MNTESTTATSSAAGGALCMLEAPDSESFELGELTASGEASSSMNMSGPGASVQFSATANSVTTSQRSPTQQELHQGKSGNSNGASATKRRATPNSPSFSWNDILRVQNLIERCLQQCLSKNEIVATLHTHAKVDPSFTAVVWQKLEEQNPGFFRTYKLQLKLKDQILAFNTLVSKQKEMMSKSGVASSDPRRMENDLLNGIPPPSSMNFSFSPTGSMPNPFGPASPLPFPLPSPIKSELDTHAFFT